MAAHDGRDALPQLIGVRAALARRIEETSLRHVAREVGMSPSGLQKFLDGSDPYTATRHKLERWYVAEAGRGYGKPDPGASLCALRLIVRDLSPPERPAAARRVLDALRASYAAAERKLPSWLREAEREWREG
jgi:hypothetical protein